MKKKLPWGFLIFAVWLPALSISSLAQQSCQATFGAINRATPKLGFNTNGQIPAAISPGTASGANWTQQWFIDSTIYLSPEILRFPGGTNSNHWDWQTGWFKPGYQPPSTPLTIRVEEFKPGLIGCNAEGLFVVNLETSNANYEMDGLRHANSLGLTPALFELGNEHNLDADTTYPLQLMTPTFYSQLAKIYYDSIKAEFPLGKIGVVGGNTNNAPGTGWNDTLLNYIPAIDAFAFHVYLHANNADLVFNVNRALAIPFGSVSNNTSLTFRYNKAGFDSLPVSKEVWVTEYNLEETQIASTPVIAKTWTHLLYLTAMNNFFLSQSNITIILNHSLAAASSHYESISKIDKHITANGLSSKLMSDVSRGSQTCQNLTFSGNPSIVYGNATIPKLMGWKFNHTGVEKGFLCNFSADTFNLSLSGVFPNAMQYDQYYADTAFIVNGLSSVNKYAGNSNDTLIIYPFSITQIYSTLNTGIKTKQITNNGLWIYPNPSQGSVTIQTNHSLSNAEILVYNIIGKEISRIQNVSGQKTQIPTDHLPKGTYLIRIKNGGEELTTKLIID